MFASSCLEDGGCQGGEWPGSDDGKRWYSDWNCVAGESFLIREGVRGREGSRSRLSGTLADFKNKRFVKDIPQKSSP